MSTGSTDRNDDATRLELYKLVVEMADRTSARRAGANAFFLTLNAALAALVGIVSSARKARASGSVPSFDAFGLVITAIAGIVLSLTWWALLRYYRRLNGAKFDVINEIEKSFPEQPYTKEWQILHPLETLGDDEKNGLSTQNRLERWLRRSRHREATVVEQVVPLVFAAIYLALGSRVLLR